MIYNAVDYMLKQIKLLIPNEILIETFLNVGSEEDKLRSLDGLLKEKIIIDIVLRECNLYTGKPKKIPLLASWAQNMDNDNIDIYYSNTYSAYKIPPQAREFKDIIYVIDIAYPLGYGITDPYIGNGYHSVISKTNELFESTFNAGSPTPIPILKEHNLVILEPPQPHHIDWILICLLGFDSSFTNIKPIMVKKLGKLAVLATKMYVYNKLIIQQDAFKTHLGYEIGSFKSIVESYSDAEEKFEEALMDFRGAATFDEESTLALLNLML